jgi:hypothetical protein
LKAVLAGLLALLALAPVLAQAPDLGPVSKAANDALGQVVPPLLNATYTATGQNITREDVRIFVDLNFTKGDVNFLGLLVGSGKAEVQASLHARIEMRVISSERIRAALEGDNAYNMSAENATFLSEVYLPAEVFRATLAGEVVALFQDEQEAAMAQYFQDSVPELKVLGVEFKWSNIHPTQTFTDLSLTEPPIVLEVDLVAQYIRIESIRSLLEVYFDVQENKDEGKADYIDQVKAENGTALRSRDFFAAAAYTQLLNLSMQPGWSLDIGLHLPRGYSFTYFNDEVEQADDRNALFKVNALDADDDVDKVFLASITHRKAIAFALLVALWASTMLVAFPLRALYGRYRLGRMKAK